MSLIKSRTYLRVVLFLEISTRDNVIFLVSELEYFFDCGKLTTISCCENVFLKLLVGEGITPDLVVLAFTYCFPVPEIWGVGLGGEGVRGLGSHGEGWNKLYFGGDKIKKGVKI